MSREAARFAKANENGRPPAQSPPGRDRPSTPTLAAFSAAAVIAAAALIFDVLTPPVVSVGIFYIAIVLTGFWFPWPRAPFALALVATPLIITGYWMGEPGYPLWQIWANRTSDIGAVWLVAVFVWYIRLLKQKLEAQIDITHALSREMTHRVGNSLQLVASLLRLRAASATSENWRSVLETVHSHVMSIGKIERMLSHSGSAGVVYSGSFINALIGDICSTLSFDAMRITVEADTAELTSTTAIALGALLIELIHNALKHAFRGVEEGTLTVRFFNQQDANQYVLEVEDDGVGIGPAQRSDGSGLKTVTELARLIRGSITCQTVRPSDVRPGTKWRLVVPHGAPGKRSSS